MDGEKVIFSFKQYRDKNPTQVIDLSIKDHRDRVSSCIGYIEEHSQESRVIRLFRILNKWDTNSKAIMEDSAARGAFLALTNKIIEDGTEIIEENGDIKAIIKMNSNDDDLPYLDMFDCIK